MILGPAPLGHPSATAGGILPRMTTTRLARAEDLPLLAGIEDAGDTLFAERFGGVDWPAASSGEERAAEPGILLVAVADDGTVVGFTHVLDLDGHWHLEQIAVDPVHGRHGIGAALLEATHDELAARGVREVTLMTYADVPWNGPFYARHGYVELDPLPARLEPIRETEQRMGMGRHGRRIAMVRDLTAR
jgi:GNAT superfamily N-acetyltransferase